MNADRHGALRGSLVVTWLVTAGVSLVERNGQSLALLRRAGVVDDDLAAWLICGGAAVDIAIGLALAFAPGRRACLAALSAMGAMTLVATWLLPALWLDPLGPLLKNLPIAAALWVLMRRNP